MFNKKEYQKKYQKEYREKNKEKISLRQKKWREKNKEKIILKSKEYREKNKERINKYYWENIEKLKKYHVEYNIKNNKKRKEYQKEYRKKNREKRLKNSKEHYLKNREKIIKRNAIYSTFKRRTNINWALKSRLSCRVRAALRGKGTKKSKKTMELLGVPHMDFFKTWIECKFKPGMTWENRHLWHIDHVIPCSSFDLTKPEEQAKCFHYTNLQPLWASENLSKGNRIS